MIKAIKIMKGFTLFEVMIAVAIFGVVGTISAIGLNQLIVEVESVKQENSRLSELQMAFLTIGRDVQQTVNRPIRDIYGDNRNAFVSSNVGEYKFELSKIGYRNPAKFLRSNMQRVAYLIEDNNLYRVSWPALDQFQGIEPRRRLLIKDVDALDLRFLNKEGEWITEWPPLTNEIETDPGLPRAVEVSLDLKEMEKINRVFILPSNTQVVIK